MNKNITKFITKHSISYVFEKNVNVEARIIYYYLSSSLFALYYYYLPLFIGYYYPIHFGNVSLKCMREMKPDLIKQLIILNFVKNIYIFTYIYVQMHVHIYTYA